VPSSYECNNKSNLSLYGCGHDYLVRPILTIVSTKAFSILLALAVVFQSLLGGLGAAGTICLGGGHEHPAGDITQSCELDCSHASSFMVLPAPVEDNHTSCSCVDIELSVSEQLTTPPRLEVNAVPEVLLLPIAQVTLPLVDWGSSPWSSHAPSWFDPGGIQRIADISTTRLIV